MKGEDFSLLNNFIGVLDVKLRLKNNTIIDIEIQNRWNSEFIQRTIFFNY